MIFGMRPYFTSLYLCVVCAVCSSKVSADDAIVHNWSSIHYPKIKCPWVDGFAHPILEKSSNGLRFVLSFYLSFDPNAVRSLTPSTDKISVSIWRMGDQASHVMPTRSGGGELFSGSFASAKSQHISEFSWNKNTDDELLIEVRFPGHVYYLEIPYGFSSNAEKTVIVNSTGDRSQLKHQFLVDEKGANYVEWEYVTYNLRKIQNAWTATARHFNNTHCDFNIELFRDSRWEYHDPQISAEITLDPETHLFGKKINIEIDETGRHRTDVFRIAPVVKNLNRRDWIAVRVTIDNETQQYVIPSSLY
jgi:hypothetical protein